MESKASPYLLIFRETAPENYEAMPVEEREELLQRWNHWYDGLAGEGRLQHGHPLEPKGRVVSHERIVDGPFAEAKEVIGGYFLVMAASLEEASEMAQGCPNLRHGMVVEVRPIAGGCHLARSLGREQMKQPAGA
ncbi:MAG: YciI family protein [Verrucomicrobiota bacterium]